MAKNSLVLPSSAVPRRAVAVTRSHLDRAKIARGVLLLALLLAVAAGMFQFATPPVAPLTAPPTEFSAARAMQHLQVIAREPHPIGSAANERVRDYLVTQLRALGLEPEVQTATAGRDLYFGARLGAVQNVIARLKGTQPGKGIMLVAHYDSVPSSPGASDDGAAVAAMLETARALNVGTPLQHDVILLFTDGEEDGLLGARAFVDEHPWAKDVGLALNFEARGSRGPAVMFETSSGNSRLIDEFAQATPYPVAYSFVYSIYQLLPNDTDLTMFKDLHPQSLNFGYVFDWPAYHSMRDTVETIDPRSLQHHGSHMLALTQHFGNRAFAQPSERDAVFFTLLPGMLVHYSEAWVLPLAVAVTLLFAGVLAFGLRRNLLTVGGLVGGFVAFLLNAVLSLVAVTLAWWAIQQLNANYRVLLNGTTYETTLYLLAFIALIAAILSGLSVLFLRKVRVENLAMGALGIWTILMLLTSIALPGFSYLFTWPLLAALLAMLWRLRTSDRRFALWWSTGALALAAIPGIIILTPAIYLLFAMLGLSFGPQPVVGVSLLLVPLLYSLLIPHVALLSRRARVRIPGGLALLSAGLLIAANLQSGFEADHPKPSSIMYSLDVDTGKAEWISIDEAPDAWTAQFLGAQPQHGRFEIVPGVLVEAMTAKAPAVAVAPPDVSVVDDTITGDIRRLRLRLTSPRRPWMTTITATAEGGIGGVTVDGRRFDLMERPMEERKTWSLSYVALPAEGVELALDLMPGETLTLVVSDTAHGLPQIPGTTFLERPSDSMAAPIGMSDAAIVTKTFRY